MEIWITVIFSVSALAISILSYFRDRNIELQNQLYLKKLDAFGEIIGLFFRLLNLLRAVEKEAESLISGNKSFVNSIKLNELGSKIDEGIEEIHKEISLKTVFFSETMIDEISSHLDSLYGQISTNEATPSMKELDTYINLQTAELDKLIVKMKKELGLKKMNQELLSRVKKWKFRTNF